MPSLLEIQKETAKNSQVNKTAGVPDSLKQKSSQRYPQSHVERETKGGADPDNMIISSKSRYPAGLAPPLSKAVVFYQVIRENEKVKRSPPKGESHYVKSKTNRDSCSC